MSVVGTSVKCVYGTKDCEGHLWVRDSNYGGQVCLNPYITNTLPCKDR